MCLYCKSSASFYEVPEQTAYNNFCPKADVSQFRVSVSCHNVRALSLRIGRLLKICVVSYRFGASKRTNVRPQWAKR